MFADPNAVYNEFRPAILGWIPELVELHHPWRALLEHGLQPAQNCSDL